jgi:spectrin alpha
VNKKNLERFVGNKLKEASQQQQFNRNIEDIEVWLGEIEGQFLSEDYGKVRV